MTLTKNLLIKGGFFINISKLSINNPFCYMSNSDYLPDNQL